MWFFRRVRKIAKSDYHLHHVCPSVRLSVQMKQLGSHWTDFNEISYLSIFRISFEVRHVTFNSNKNNAYFTWKPVYIFLIIARSFLFKMKNISDKICWENQNALFWFDNFLRTLCLVWNNMEKYFRAGCNRRQHGACALHAGYLRLHTPTHTHTHTHKHTNTHSEHVILIAFPLQQCLHECASLLLYMHITCLVINGTRICDCNAVKRQLMGIHLILY
jgi:hypothetical protein